jgi:hypothetical protein
VHNATAFETAEYSRAHWRSTNALAPLNKESNPPGRGAGYSCGLWRITCTMEGSKEAITVVPSRS